MSYNSPFKPLTLAGIDEGRVLRSFDAEFKRAQRGLCQYADVFGDRAKKARAKITLTVEIEVVNVEEAQFDVLTKMDVRMPSRPPKLTSAFASADEDGKPRLFARASGSTEGDPRQMVLSTEDGDAVDPDTGEVVARGRGRVDLETGEVIGAE